METRLLLDTHAAIWLLEGSAKLGAAARSAVNNAESVALSDLSLLEVAMLGARGSIVLRPDIASALEAFRERLVILPIDAHVAAEAVRIALPHRDPFDRVIAATARVHGLTLVTRDRRIAEAGVVTVIW
jgi:PIN domain nuclease of toxin-antitoxin system